MAKIVPPCKPDCPGRHPACQNPSCEAYMAFKAEMKGQKEWLKKYQFLDSERVGRITDDIASTSPRWRKDHHYKRRKKERKA